VLYIFQNVGEGRGACVQNFSNRACLLMYDGVEEIVLVLESTCFLCAFTVHCIVMSVAYDLRSHGVTKCLNCAVVGKF
jgi:hypothetical protein